MKLLITGSTGLVGSHLVETLQKDNRYSLILPSSQEMDIGSKDSVYKYISQHNPDIIINYAAYTDVTKAEEQRDNFQGPTWKINVEGMQNLVEASKNTYFIHISTDMVFSGKEDDKGPYPEDHPIETNSNRVSWYGWTKIQQENILKQNLKDFAIIRIANPVRQHFLTKLDHLHKVLVAYDAGKPIKLFADQYLSLTYINDVTTTISKILENKPNDIFHITSSNLYTPYDLGAYLLKKARNIDNVVQKSSLTEFLKLPGNENRYLQYGGLAVQETEKKLDMQMKRWEEIVDEVIV